MSTRFSPFESNIINLYDDKGRAWLDELPKLIEQAASNLGLHDLKLMPNLSYHYVLTGFQRNNPIILKMGLDCESLKREAFALKCFAGWGAIKVIAETLTTTSGLLLLERAVPGISLKSYFSTRDDEAVEIACNVMKKLHQAPILKNHAFPHIKDWLSSLDKDWDIPAYCLIKARQLRDQLLETAGPDVLLHGDLHHDNILQNAGGWAVIDPKGVVGEAAFEAAAFIRNPIPDLLEQENTETIIQKRIAAFAIAFGISIERMANWSFVQAVLAWVWALEDGGDTQYWVRLASIMDNQKKLTHCRGQERSS